MTKTKRIVTAYNESVKLIDVEAKAPDPDAIEALRKVFTEAVVDTSDLVFSQKQMRAKIIQEGVPEDGWDMLAHDIASWPEPMQEQLRKYPFLFNFPSVAPELLRQKEFSGEGKEGGVEVLRESFLRAGPLRLPSLTPPTNDGSDAGQVRVFWEKFLKFCEQARIQERDHFTALQDFCLRGDLKESFELMHLSDPGLKAGQIMTALIKEYDMDAVRTIFLRLQSLRQGDLSFRKLRHEIMTLRLRLERDAPEWGKLSDKFWLNYCLVTMNADLYHKVLPHSPDSMDQI